MFDFLLLDRTIFVFTRTAIILGLISILITFMKIELINWDKQLMMLFIVGFLLITISILSSQVMEGVSYKNVLEFLLASGIILLAISVNKALKKLAYIATYDSLTGIYNKNNLKRILKKCVKKAKKDNSSLSVIFMDINNFKNVNDNLGHEIGDKFLQKLVKTIKSNIRKRDLFIRYGGDEFILILPDTNIIDAKEIEERIVTALNNSELSVYGVSLGIGIANYPEDTYDIEELISFADRRMYQNKQQIKN
ncbi:diguanylate cyclase/phosphodiesterase (GGDEF & EAL domains) with PAS/PAC sensor(s) [Candidatus Syntrophocurvum alkaliphilum]|uniref:Diguanylate cyclase/phosphodiesterase (GGDEF & EAL domains) with PAS/PAC sensor(S) n=1 Tax=Candidatus Syntrophocurvum alkaliphilum TaxID=2293317 RepID=A0A6I6DEP8_9FIRM|nr:diguanylate cyclase [Candidatus Syntrophocurvum alkaliphilum]QGT99482.1 diguanylate cyclase/phosphodiesterase (GGDEF & EAL domains) with PAS/PAC sensor(s) [Candidatus Syntrophocurvum alkaliphilum]